MKTYHFPLALLLIALVAFIDPVRTVRGTITDDAGNPVIAYIRVKGISTGVSTAGNGRFTIRITAKDPVLVITAVGFEPKEVPVLSQNRLQIVLGRTSVAVNSVRKDTLIMEEKSIMREMLEDVTVLNARAAGPRPLQKRTPLNSVVITDRNRKWDQRSYNREGYDAINENPFLTVTGNPLSTFSIDVDAASYSNIRRLLKQGELPPAGAVRIEEMVNYFTYEYPAATGKEPFAVHTEFAVCPWNTRHQLMLIGLQAKKTNAEDLPSSNLTFLIDVSGSMLTRDKLPLVKSSLQLLTDQLRPNDKVAIVVYAGSAGLVLPATSGDHKTRIKEAIEQLEAGGSTAGGAGIALAYKVANENFEKGGNNRVILCTDGDFNVGASSDDALERMIENERETGVYLTVLGYGTGNYQDAKMQKLADKGNGNHAYIDGLGEAKKVLINEFGGTLFTIAKDVKLQLEFNPAKVKGYRLIGYENRLLAKEDFNDDTKDAGDMGSGHTVTALYELIPLGESMREEKKVDTLRYQAKPNFIPVGNKNPTNELVMIKLRYKKPGCDTSLVFNHPVTGNPVSISESTANFRFAAAVASFGMLLRNSEYKGSADLRSVRLLASKALGTDKEGYRKEFLALVDAAEHLKKPQEVARRED